MDEVIIRELGGGTEAILVAMLVSALGILALVVRALWIVVQEERNRTSEVQANCNRDLREMQLSTLKTLNDVDKSLSALNTTIRERRREDDR